VRNQTVTSGDTACPDPRAMYEDPDGSVLRQIQELEAMSVRELQAKHLELYGFETRSKHKTQLFKRLAWRVQELKWGGIPDEVIERLREIEDDRDARFLPPRKPSERVEVVEVPRRAQKRVPVPGTVVEREYEGELHRVTILDKGVSYRGRQFRSLSGVAREITGTIWNGKRFFGLVDANGGPR
jgi:Protein of unknown function (DUF2924)